MLRSTKDLGQGAVLGQGVYQDEKGRAYKHVFYPASKRMDRVIWTVPPLSPALQGAMLEVERESKGYLAAREIVPTSEEQRLKLEAIERRGPTYMSIELFNHREI